MLPGRFKVDYNRDTSPVDQEVKSMAEPHGVVH